MRGRQPLAAERIYRALLALYPREFRNRFGDDIAQLVRDRARTATKAGGDASRIWMRAMGDLVISALAERVSSVREFVRDVLYAGSDFHSPTHDRIAMNTFTQDVRYAVRGILSRPGLSAIIIATLALGIGANTAIFSVVEGVMLRALPYADPAGIVHVMHDDPYTQVSEGEFVDYRNQVRSFSRVAAYTTTSASLTGDRDPEQLQVARVADGFFSILGTSPALGRPFTREEDVRGAPRVAMISNGLWVRQFGGDSAILGKLLRLNGNAYTIVGVLPRHFDYPSSDVSVWVPLRINYDTLWGRNNHYMQMIARLAPGIPVEGAQREMLALTKTWPAAFPDIYAANKPPVVKLTPISDAVLGHTRPYLYSLLGAVAFVLIIACVNVANLLLANTAARRREMAIRAALGATRGRIVRQVLTESGLYAMAGAVIGLPLAWWGWRTLRAFAPDSIPRLDQISLNVPVLLFTLTTASLTAFFFGIVPALRAARSDAAETLTTGARSGGGRRLRRVRGALVVAEIALAVVTLTGAGLMLRSLRRLQSVNLGVDSAHVLTVRVAVPPARYQGEKLHAFYRDLEVRIRALPGVKSVGAIADLPIADGMSTYSILLDGQPQTSVALAPGANPEQVTPGYFAALGIPITKGRVFSNDDRANAPLVAIVNEAMVRKYWPNVDPIGHTIKMLNETSPWATVVGVARDVRHGGYQADAQPTMYFPYEQASQSVYLAPAAMSLVIKATGDEMSLVAPVRQIVRELDPAIPLARVQSMSGLLDASIAGRTFSTRLLGLFAVLALALAAIGIYGVISYGVSQRRFELGLRVALGAQRREIISLILREGLVLAATGMVAGTAGALIVMRFARSILVETSIGDPATLIGVAILLGGVATLATYLPARRVMSLNPTETLRGG